VSHDRSAQTTKEAAASGPETLNGQLHVSAVADELQALDLAEIRPNPEQPRKHFGDLTELAASIQEHGLLEPVLVRPVPGGYELVHGERRWRAAAAAGLKTIPAMVRDLSDDEAFVAALVENIQRENLNPIEEANALKRLIDGGRTQAEAGALVGKGQSYVAHKLRLLTLPEPIACYLSDGTLTEGHARQLLRLRDAYPAGLTRKFNETTPAVENFSEADLPLLLHQLRPEEATPLVRPLPASVVANVKTFFDHVTRHEGEVPQWVVAGAWWAALTVTVNLPVADLARGLDAWKERYETALAWWQFLRRDDAGHSDEALWWAFHADLKHSGSLDVQLDSVRLNRIVAR
jgi:ParB family chromosome partitioning protein